MIPTRRLALASFVLALAAGAGAETPPGATPRTPALEARLSAALERLGPDYQPRTRHLLEDGSPRFSNRLLLESSPYLRQHAHNPVDWFPWGDEAFETARRLGRPVLLSIGYSTCHWCHVMEEESFESTGIARLLNQRYVAVKVDREERPDVDAVYLGAVQLLTGGHGGWPLTVWLTPEREPFYGATYLPPEDGARGIRVGFETLLTRLADVHAEQAGDVSRSAARVVSGLRELLDGGAAGGEPEDALLTTAVERLAARYDDRYGGVVGRQKFPGGLPLELLLVDRARRGGDASLRMVVQTLESLRDGGIRDHVGGGIHRYTTDPEWRVPHFEKMLYDNALLVRALLGAARATGREDFRDVAREILDWAEREMSHPDGGFYSATDADSKSPEGERVEGLFFTWTPAELEAALGPEAAALVAARYGVDAEGDLEGRSVLHVARSLEDLAAERGLRPAEVGAVLERSLETLRRARDARPRPLRDEKVLAGWNGLMISALARAAVALGEPARARRAEAAAGFVLDRLGPPERLRRAWSAGSVTGRAVLEDHALLAAGLIDLYQATGGTRWLDAALGLEAALWREYRDAARGGFFATAESAEALLVRPRNVFDGALPSGNGVHVQNLARLAVLTGDDGLRERGEWALAGFASALERAPEAAAAALVGLHLLRADPREIVLVVPTARDEAEPFLAELRRRHLPEAVLLVAVEGEDLAAQSRLVPLLDGKVSRGGRPTAYVCRRGVCRLPTDDPAAFARLLDGEGG